MKNYMLYSDNYFDYKNSDAEIWCSNEDGEETILSISEAIDKNLYHELEDFIFNEYEYFKELCDGCCNGNVDKVNYFIVDGYFEGWMGKQEGGLISDKKLYELISDLRTNDCYSEIKICVENNTLYVYNSHHDGCSRYKIKALTKKGEQWYLNHKYDDRRYLVEHLMNTKGYTKNIYFYGK